MNMQTPIAKRLLVVFVIVLAVLIDQAIKMWVHTTFYIGESMPVTSWFWLCYVENNGMAFGIEWIPKILLTSSRIVAVVMLAYYLHYLTSLKRHARLGYILTIAFVTAGALGNIVDSVFYGVLFDYAPLFYGRVIDMLYFPLIHDSAGNVLFFQPVFNVADSYITCAVMIIILFYHNELDSNKKRMGNSSSK